MIPNYLPGREEIKQYQDTLYDNTNAAFGYVKKIAVQRPNGTIDFRYSLKWGTCRDTFQGTENQDLINGFVFTHPIKRGFDAACFLAKIEHQLNIQSSQYRITDLENVTFCLPSSWWFTTEMRKSFFTLMIRAAYNYKREHDNFEDALFSFQYTKETKTAVNKFLNGYTIYNYIPKDTCDHWFKQFAICINPNVGNSNLYIYQENKDNIDKLKPSHELISRKAYELWLQHGEHSNDQNHWYQAEELLEKIA